MRKNTFVELLRLIATLIILFHHSYLVRVPASNTPFQVAWIYVEFFLILTGFFTMAHFSKRQKEDLNEIAKESFVYT
jgi:peptidoglycan/LPS O-acetylase OafA/YrhL